jgi:hypothetical protein
MDQRTMQYKRMFGTGFVSLHVTVDDVAYLKSSQGEVKLTGLRRDEVARMARKLQFVCSLKIAGLSGDMAELVIRKVAVAPVDLYWDRKGLESRRTGHWKQFGTV